jgi:hypothetical protein
MKEIEILLMFLIFAFHVIRVHNSTLAAAAALHFNHCLIL